MAEALLSMHFQKKIRGARKCASGVDSRSILAYRQRLSIASSAKETRLQYAPLLNRLAMLCLILAGLALPARAADLPAPPATPLDIHTELFRLPADAPASVSGAPYLAVMTVDPHPGLYIYGHTPGGLGLPTVAEVRADGGEPLPVLYPPGKAKDDPFNPGQTVFVYEDLVRLFIPLAAVPASLELTASGLLCSDTTCLPFEERRSLRFEVPKPTALPEARNQAWWPELAAAKPGTAKAETPEPAVAAPSEAPSWDFSPQAYTPGLEVTGVLKAALLAFLAGLILNFMPCVLPVASLKLKGILSGCVEGATDSPVHCFRCYNIWFALGILVYFLALSVILSSAGLVWGQLFQSPTFILVLTLLVFAMGLSLCGLFDLPVIDLKAPTGAAVSRRSAFLTGILATLLATPCSGPFLGGVLAWTLIQPPLVIAAIFLCIGLGMASPYLFMAARPNLIAPFQRPGAWTSYVERVAAFFLFGTCVYFLQILPQRLLWRSLVALLVTAFAGWIWGSWTSLSHCTLRRCATRLLAVALVAAAFVWTLNPPPPTTHWQPFDPAELKARLGRERLLLDFTADWCPNCKFLELTTLSDGNLDKWAEEYGLKYVKVDLTEQNQAAQSLLEAMGARSIPVVAVIPDGAEAARPLVMRDLFTAGTMDQALENLFEKK
jgi:thiol:disulfide interchange protein DsbD